MSRFEYNCAFMGWRRHNWRFNFTEFHTNDGKRLGTWQCWLGPFVICRIFKWR